MIGNPKKPRKLSPYSRQLLAIVDKYKAETGEQEPNLYKAAMWAEEKGLIDLPIVDPHRVLARNLARACQQDYVVDENGEPVRRRHAVKIVIADEQTTLWPNMEHINPAKMRASLNRRRKGSGEDILQIERDRRYYNKKHNPGDPIEMDYNYNTDVEEHFMPTEYPDAPPEGKED
jgi:hypothetical protein